MTYNPNIDVRTLPIPASSLPLATAVARGAVQVDQAAVGGSPIAVTFPRMAYPGGPVPTAEDGGIGSLFLPPVAGSIAELGRWTESGDNPIIPLGGGGASDSAAIAEPCVLFDGGIYKMWYGGTPNTEINSCTHYATCPGAADPTVAANWTKYVSNPVIAAPSLEFHCFKLADGRFRGFRNNHADLIVCESPDGITWTDLNIAVATGTAGYPWWIQCCVWQEATIWQGILGAGASSGGPFVLFHATSTDGLHWTIDTGFGALTSLGVGGTTVGSPWMPVPKKVRGLYHLYYHAAPSGTDPNNIYHATSSDLLHWTIVGGTYVLGHGVPQQGDPWLVEAYGKSYMFHDHTGIGIASFPGTLAQLFQNAPLDAGAVAPPGTFISMATGSSAPPVPLWTSDGVDYCYQNP